MNSTLQGIPSLPASCLAEYVTGTNRSRESLLRPYKYKERGEGHARITFYPPAVSVIRRYYKSGKDKGVLDAAILDWERRIEQTDQKGLRTKLLSNIMAVRSYQRLYGNRDFRILPVHRIRYQIGPVVWTAPPDLWVEEEGTQVLIKIGFARKTRNYTNIVLTVMRKAAIRHGYRVRARNIVYLDVPTGEERVCSVPLNRLNRTLIDASREIAAKWASVAPAVRTAGARTRAKAAGA